MLSVSRATPVLNRSEIRDVVVELHEPVMLENKWTLWFDRYLGPGLSVEEYQASLKKLGTFNTIQDFWKWFNNIPSAENLPARTSYHIMKEGIRPLWEDSANVEGGSLSVKLSKNQTNYVWLQLILGVIGEQFSQILAEEDDICGLSISMRKDESVITLWNKKAIVLNINRVSSLINRLLPRAQYSFLSYKVHKNEINFSKSP